jgi:hypothetical protein
MIKSIVLLASIIFGSFISFGQSELTVPLIDIQSNYRGCCRPVVQRPPSSCCAVEIRKEEKSEEVLDITDPEISGLVASPNPTKGNLSVSVPPSLIGYQITVLDMTGRFVGNPIPIKGTTENLTIEGESGVYLIVIRTEKQVIKERILLDTQ